LDLNIPGDGDFPGILPLIWRGAVLSFRPLRLTFSIVEGGIAAARAL